MFICNKESTIPYTARNLLLFLSFEFHIGRLLTIFSAGFFHIFISVNRSAFTLICGVFKFKLLNDWVSQCPNVQFEPYFHISSDLNNELQGLFLSPFLGTSGPILIYFSIPHQKDKNTNYFVFLVKMH